jgi:hypothetical protein
VDENNRTDRRFRTEIPAAVSTVLDRQEAYIVDVSQQGIRLRGVKAAPRMRVIIECEGDAVGGTVRWAKEDGTIGVRLDTPLKDGPLAGIWKRFNDNVTAFGANRAVRVPRAFGKRSNE